MEPLSSKRRQGKKREDIYIPRDPTPENSSVKRVLIPSVELDSKVNMSQLKVQKTKETLNSVTREEQNTGPKARLSLPMIVK